MAWWWRGNPYQVRKDRGWRIGSEPEWWLEERDKFLQAQNERRRLAARKRMAAGSFNVQRPRGATRIPSGANDEMLERWAKSLRRGSKLDRMNVSELYYGSLLRWAKANSELCNVGERQMSAWLKARGFAWKRMREGTCFVGLKKA